MLVLLLGGDDHVIHMCLQVSVRIYGLKREGGELFKKDFCKLLSLELKILQENLD